MTSICFFTIANCQIGHFRVPLCLCFKTSLSANHSNENEFNLHENEPVGGTHFYMNGFALRLVLTRRQKGTWEMAYYPLSPVDSSHKLLCMAAY